MIKQNPNKLWGCIPTNKSLEEAEKYKYFYANDDHILVISNCQPYGMVEMTEEYIPLLQKDDWEWITKVSEMIREEQEVEYQEELIRLQEEFVSRFEEELSKRKGVITNGEREESSTSE